MIDAERLVIRRRLPATQEQLFAEWTDPKGMREWMCPEDVVSSDIRMDPRVGGSLLILMRGPDTVHEHRGEFKVVDPPNKLVFTWIAKATADRPTLVTVEFRAVGDNETELVLTHELFPTTGTRDQYRGGWSLILDHLEAYWARRQ